MFLGIGIGLTARRGGGGGPVQVTRLAHRRAGVGDNGANMTLLTGDGSEKTYSLLTLTNESGYPISVARVVFQGWTISNVSPFVIVCPNDITVTGTIEFPVGTTVGTITSTVVPGGGHVVSDAVTLGASIPAGATFGVRFASTVPNADKYVPQLGFAGLCTVAMSNEIRPHALFGIGDSIVANNNGLWLGASTGRCPCYQVGIGGTRAGQYASGTAGAFAKQAALAAAMGCTYVVSNFGTNDIGAGDSSATLLANLQTLQGAANAQGVLFAQATMTPRTSWRSALSATLTSSGNVITATVEDASLFVPGDFYTIAGAAETEYNGSKLCLSSDGVDTVTLLFVGSGTTPATGTITITSWARSSSIDFMVADSTGSGWFAFGADSPRAIWNDALRAGAFDSFVELADYCEPSRGAGRWKVKGEDAALPVSMDPVTVSSVISTYTRFNSNYNRGNNTITSGLVQWRTGANAGLTRIGNGNSGGDITLTSALPNAIQVGDTCVAMPGLSYATDDGLHPRVSVGSFGGQRLVLAGASAFLTGLGL